MTWVPVALTTALSFATTDALCKKALGSSGELTVAWARYGYALPFLLLAFIFIPVPKLDQTFWLTILALVPLEVTALLLYMKAIRIAPLSLSVPFISLTPVFIILSAFIMLGELPGAAGACGIALIAAGAYLLNLGSTSRGFLGPIKAAFKERATLLMALVALIYSVTSTLGKVAVMHSSPVFFGCFYPFILTLALSVLIRIKGGAQHDKGVFSRPLFFGAIGFFSSLMIITHYIALGQTQVAYMISVKRTSLLFSVIYGRVLFKETNIRERLLGSAVMLAGMALITVWGS